MSHITLVIADDTEVFFLNLKNYIFRNILSCSELSIKSESLDSSTLDSVEKYAVDLVDCLKFNVSETYFSKRGKDFVRILLECYLKKAKSEFVKKEQYTPNPNTKDYKVNTKDLSTISVTKEFFQSISGSPDVKITQIRDNVYLAEYNNQSHLLEISQVSVAKSKISSLDSESKEKLIEQGQHLKIEQLVKLKEYLDINQTSDGVTPDKKVLIKKVIDQLDTFKKYLDFVFNNEDNFLENLNSEDFNYFTMLLSLYLGTIKTYYTYNFSNNSVLNIDKEIDNRVKLILSDYFGFDLIEKSLIHKNSVTPIYINPNNIPKLQYDQNQHNIALLNYKSSEMKIIKSKTNLSQVLKDIEDNCFNVFVLKHLIQGIVLNNLKQSKKYELEINQSGIIKISQNKKEQYFAIIPNCTVNTPNIQSKSLYALDIDAIEALGIEFDKSNVQYTKSHQTSSDFFKNNPDRYSILKYFTKARNCASLNKYNTHALCNAPLKIRMEW